MELNENAKENIWFETIYSMTQREIEYKKSIDKRIAGIRNRQIISICISSILFTLLSAILFIAVKNLNDMKDLIQILMEGFQKLAT